MAADDELLSKLADIEAQFRRAGPPVERARATMGGTPGSLDSSHADCEPEVELQFSLPDIWSVSLFVAVCRTHGIRPYRYPRQKRTTVMVRARESAFHRAVWPEFNRLQTELESYFNDVTDHLIERVMGSKGDDGGLDRV